MEDDGLFLWPDFMVQLPWSNFFKNKIEKSLGPSLGVKKMWIKRNDHAPKMNLWIFLIYAQEKVVLKEKKRKNKIK
jgi:hypothetical protein